MGERGHILSRFSRNFEAKASEFLKYIEEEFSLCVICITMYVTGTFYLITQNGVIKNMFYIHK